jgi:signal transduction histidine kinase
LSLCRSLVERDGGTIAVDSAFGQGTTVVIKLPIPAEV